MGVNRASLFSPRVIIPTPRHCEQLTKAPRWEVKKIFRAIHTFKLSLLFINFAQ
jgi:hypothetical protein